MLTLTLGFTMLCLELNAISLRLIPLTFLLYSLANVSQIVIMPCNAHRLGANNIISSAYDTQPM